MKFPQYSQVRHLKTGGVYLIVHGPDVCKLEIDQTPVYAYVKMETLEPIWIRPQQEMEDGRFELVALPAGHSAPMETDTADDAGNDQGVDHQ